uniref:P-type ATPase N-terminal domain-containing protein n=1 Tax=Panagrolaimus davidi TaxID=227884 RepID=A0A914QDF1_9BILA
MKDLGTSPSKEIHTQTTEITNEVSTRSSQIHPLSTGKFSLALCLRNIFNPYQKRYPRTIKIGKCATLSTGGTKFPVNAVCNTKYNILTFVPLVLFQQFKFFINLYFLLIACCQFIPAIRTEDPLTYWGPLAFVLTITLIKEAIDDAVRLWRDNEINNETYEKLTLIGSCKVKSKDIKVGDLVVIHKDKRIPSDVVLLRTTEKAGTCFVRTDQLDGEKDWKLRVSIPPIQALSDNGQILNMNCEIYADKPQKDIHAFIGTYKIVESDGKIIDGSLSVENVLWQILF